jgi:predicted ATPase/DNA-binding CsgD family transcriptional regulator
VSGRSGRGNLPAELSSFVGRRREVAEVGHLLAGNRLVTLSGPGGVGKTRLALQAADRVRRSFGDGVWLVELAPVVDAEFVTSAIAAALGVTDQPEQSVSSVLSDYLEDKRLLLVLDNCEHLSDACAGLASKLLAAAGGLQVLATSRQPLRVEGERVVPVAPLASPAEGDRPAADFLESGAVRLFAERARAVVPAFEVGEANGPTVAALCRRVEGLPLAIELAAARIRVLTPEQILARLDDRFALLTRGSRLAPARHRTLAATLAWSFELCTAAEQQLWSRMSVFTGGFELAAAERVCAGEGIAVDEVFDLLTGLLDKSVLSHAYGEGVTARYSVLETVREYGWQRLATSGLQEELRQRHREYYRVLARQAQAERVSPREVEWLLRLREEWPNLRLAMESGLARPDTARQALEIAVALRDLWFGTGRHREALRWLTRALAADQEPSRTRVIALAEASYFALRVGEHPTSQRLISEAQVLDLELDDAHTHAVVTHTLATLALVGSSPDPAQARALNEQALEGYLATDDLPRSVNALMQLSLIATFAGHPSEGADYGEQIRALGEANGAALTQAWGLVLLALARYASGEQEQVERLLHEALLSHRLVGDSYATGICLQVLAWTAATTGHHERAARLLGAGEAVRRLNGATLIRHGPFAERHAGHVHEVQHALGDNTYTALVDEGARFTLAEAIDYALGEHHATTAAGGPPPTPLTRREQEISSLVAAGLTNKQIAERLVISHRTAEGHVERIRTKLGFTNRAQISRWVTERGIGTES